MAIKISKMAQAIEPSLSRRLFNMAKEYEDVIDLTLGDRIFFLLLPLGRQRARPSWRDALATRLMRGFLL